MKISWQWIQEHVHVAIPPVEIAQRLTLAGFEVESTHAQGLGLEHVVVAKIVESVPHPNAEKLSVTQIDAGEGPLLQVVCGAKNYAVGDHVPLAKIGAKR